MLHFDSEAKSLPSYLDIAANGNGEEKASLTIEATRRLFQESNLASVHAVEVGPGGGSAVHAIADSLPNIKNDDQNFHLSLIELYGIESSKLKTARAHLERTGSTSEFLNGSLTKISQFCLNQTVNIVSTSAVMHEVYSYSGGYGAVDDAICGIANTIEPGGFFAYRDTYAVESLSLSERARHIYDRPAWVAFGSLFFSYYLANAVHPYHRREDQVAFKQSGQEIKAADINTEEPLSIEAPIGLLREFQRHYITMRDHMWRSGALGVVPTLEGPDANDWLDRRRGHKRVHYKLLAEDPILEKVSTQSSSDHYVVDGDIFDEMSDVGIGEILNDVTKNGEDSAHWFEWASWLKREGAETYIYFDLNELLGSVALRSYNATNGKSILLPTRETDVAVAPRTYYNRYLKHEISNALPDGKQLVLFESVPLTENSGPESQKVLAGKVGRALNVLSEYCSRQMLAKIYSPIRKAIR